MGFLSWGFDRKLSRCTDRLREEASAAESPSVAGAGSRPQRVASLPTCVRRYLEHAGALELPRYR